MFDQIGGLPVHALVVHAAVVFVPLLAVGSVIYAMVIPWRPRVGWAVTILAVLTPVTTLVAKESGEQLLDRLRERGLSGRGLEILTDHEGYGSMTFWFSLALGLVTLLMVAVARARRTKTMPRVVEIVLAVAAVALAVVSGYYVYRTGDSGATAVWGTY
ncbi:DUF2231 domain-containing protein [Mangrovihabitans endophyticus]|uniref:DUF2231 domain-containing protein n=1 Tax=Mangrovihabitans endophyticus TaxID=1751298 RepID=UPI00166AFDB5|nr:DUF2231 domain-containing protein [Mangrovihabitans endophyticus]